MPFWVAYCVSSIVFMVFIVEIISGINATICGIRVSSRSMSGINC
jgi:hypothetical protein